MNVTGAGLLQSLIFCELFYRHGVAGSFDDYGNLVSWLYRI
jgi:hypothetical protein